jgi:ribosome maturation factor RimP
MAFTLDKVREIAERVAHSSGLLLWDVELKGSGAARTLRIYIDRQPGGVSHEDCAAFSREVSTIFDVEDAVPGGAYVLEVSSPGLDRRLFKPEHFTQFVGSLVKFSTREPLNGNRHFEGRLVSFDDGRLTVNLDEVGSRKKAKAQGNGVVVVPFAIVEKASLVPEF